MNDLSQYRVDGCFLESMNSAAVLQALRSSSHTLMGLIRESVLIARRMGACYGIWVMGIVFFLSGLALILHPFLGQIQLLWLQISLMIDN